MSISRLIDRTIEGILKDAQFAYDYIIYTDGTNYFAFNTKTKQIDFVGTDASTVIQSAINALPNGGKIFIKEGVYNIYSLFGTAYNNQIIHIKGVYGLTAFNILVDNPSNPWAFGINPGSTVILEDLVFDTTNW